MISARFKIMYPPGAESNTSNGKHSVKVGLVQYIRSMLPAHTKYSAQKPLAL